MPNKVSNLEKTIFTNVGIGVGLIRRPPFHKWSHSLVAWVFVWVIAQHTREGFTGSHTYKTEINRIIKIKNPENSIEKFKRREKRKPVRKNRDK
jgi:hypothetical protein